MQVQPRRRDVIKRGDFSSSFQGVPLPKVEDSIILYESEMPILTQSKQIKDSMVSPRTTVPAVRQPTEKDKIRDARQAMAAHESERYSENQSKQERSLSRKSLKLQMPFSDPARFEEDDIGMRVSNLEDYSLKTNLPLIRSP